jgi:hypothetical protein
MSEKVEASGPMRRDESIVSHPYAAIWRLVATTGVHEECLVINEKLAIPHQHAWLAGRGNHLANTAAPAEGVTLNIAADRTFCETLTTAHPNLIWFDAAGIQIGRNNFAPLNGVLKIRRRADGYLVGYLTIPGQPEANQTSTDGRDDIVLRWDEHDIKLCEFVEVEDDRLIRTINCVGDAFYFSRFVAVYVRVSG